MTLWVIYTDAQGRIQEIYADCDTGEPAAGTTRTTQQDGTPPVIDPAYAPAPATPSPSVQEQITAIIAQLTPDQQIGITNQLAGATTAKPSSPAQPAAASV